MGLKLFVSTTPEDAKLARQVTRELERAGQSAYLAEVKEGENILVKVEDELRQSDAVIVVASEDTLNNPNLAFEVGLAVGLGKRVDLLIPDVPSKELPPALRSVQRIRLSELPRYVRELARQAAEKEQIAR